MSEYMTKFGTLNTFVNQQLNKNTAPAGSASRRKTQQSLALGERSAEQTRVNTENAITGVKNTYRRSAEDAPRLTPDLQRAAVMQAIQENSDETIAELEQEYPSDASSVAPTFDSKNSNPDESFKTILQHAVGALSDVESRGSGDYVALGDVMKTGMYKGERAYGKYQVMGPNIGPWTKKHYGTSLTRKQFLDSPAAQDAVVEGRLMADWKKHGNIEDAVSIWFTGRTVKKAGNASDGRTTAPEYLSKWSRLFVKRRNQDQDN